MLDALPPGKSSVAELREDWFAPLFDDEEPVLLDPLVEPFPVVCFAMTDLRF